LPAALQAQIDSGLSARGGDVWAKSRALPAQADFPKPESACTNEGQFDVAAYMDGKKSEAAAAMALRQRNELIEATHARRRSKAASYTAARARALEDGHTLKGPLASLFGLPIGSVLPLPECETLGGYHVETERGILSENWGVLLDNPSTNQTCLKILDDGSPVVAWADGTIPEWAKSVETDIRDDVLVAVTVLVDSHPRPPPAVIVGYGAAMDMAIAQRTYENQLKSFPLNVASAKKALHEKYGAPKSHPTRLAPTNDGGAIEWGWDDHKLHVFYIPDTYVDTILIELDSATRARLDDDKKREAAVPKL
jgi:hypothetical protein